MIKNLIISINNYEHCNKIDLFNWFFYKFYMINNI